MAGERTQLHRLLLDKSETAETQQLLRYRGANSAFRGELALPALNLAEQENWKSESITTAKSLPMIRAAPGGSLLRAQKLATIPWNPA